MSPDDQRSDDPRRNDPPRDDPPRDDPRRGELRRRTFLAGAGGLGLALGAGGARLEAAAAASPAEPSAGIVAFHGDRQAGIATPPQDHLTFAAFDLVATRRSEVADLMQTWTAAAARLSAGLPASPLGDDLLAPPSDTGETVGTGAASLTLTFGFGPGLFVSGEQDRYGLAQLRPRELAELPAFAGDELDPARGGGDLAVQACADDPLVAFHAVHNLARLARGVAVLRWSQAGFGRTSSASRRQETPRNLMGYKDGTDNIPTDDAAQMARYVWVGSEGPAWLRGGSYLVARRIRMRLEAWDRSSLDEQQRTIGRLKYSGAPLGGVHEFDAVDLDALDEAGQPVIPHGAHIREASPLANNGTKILRRGYSFDDGVDASGEQDAGLFFICYQRDPAQGFVAVQNRLASSDGLNRYIRHTTSALFACPGGAHAGTWVGQSLLAR
jgi:deferrochelatase/peroxidase EfeB